jgi:uroporphyrinogen-III synthase
MATEFETPIVQTSAALGDVLSGLEVLVTRPIHQVDEWRTSLEARGAQVFSVPVLDIKNIDDPAGLQAIKNAILELDNYQIVIFVSQNAVNTACDWIDRYWPQLPVGIDFLAVGQKTAESLQREGIEVVSTREVSLGAMNSEALLALPCLQSVDAKKILICRGQGGRPLLAETLEARGAQVEYCELYQRVLPRDVKESLGNIVWTSGVLPLITVHSGESLQNLYHNLPDSQAQWWLEQALVVPGERVAQAARDFGFSQVICAENAGSESMLKAIFEWRQTPKI